MSFCPTCHSDFPDDWKRCPKDEVELLASRYVAKYRIDGVIGTGGMGAVYKALNPDTKAPVAIKLMHPEASEVETSRARFQREAAVIAGLRTRHLVSVYDFGADDDGTLYLVMEYLVGHNLRPEIDAGAGRMPVPRVNLVMDGALRGLGAAHRAGIVHRDLKPENIFLADTEDGEVAKVLDFGIARVDASSKHSALTQEGALMGTPAYMAPEQVSGRRGEIGAWTDVYSMGIIAYEMLAGATPFDASSMTEVLGRVLAREFRPLGDVRPDLPADIIALVDRAMALDPGERFRDANELRDTWRQAYRSFDPSIRDATVPEFAGDAGSSLSRLGTAPTALPDSVASIAPVVVNTTADTGTSPPRGTAKPWLAAIAVLALVGAGAGGYLALSGGSETTPPRPPRSDAPSTNGDAGAVANAADAEPDAAPVIPTKPAVPDDMVRLEGGTFEMGVDPKKYGWFKNIDVRHTETTAPFLLDRLEMSVGAHRAAMAKAWGERDESKPTPKTEPPADPRLPATKVTWTDAAAACKALGKRLPSEKEWAFAASRSPLDPKRARMRTKGVRGPAPVGSHDGDCTRDGVCDLLGNVMEWTADPWRDRSGAIDPSLRAVRGASFRVAPTDKWYATVHARVKLAKTKADAEVGYRCARDIEP